MNIETTILQIVLAFLIGFINDSTKPKLYHYKNQIVVVYKKYQCPTYCAVDHHHYVYFKGESIGMIVDKNQLGKRVKEKKNRKKNKSLTYIDQK